MVKSQSSQIRRIAAHMPGNINSQRRRLQRFVSQAEEPLAFWHGWVRTVMRKLKPTVLTLVVDESKLKDKYALLMVGVAYEGRCLPLRWATFVANEAGAYPQEGQTALIIDMLRHIKAALPARQRVRVLAEACGDVPLEASVGLLRSCAEWTG